MLYIILVLSVMLLMISAAMCSRHITDLEYQKLTGTNGIRRIESTTNTRTHINRMILAVGVMIIVLSNLIDFLPAIRAIVAWTITIIVVATFTLSGVYDWRAEYQKMFIFMKKEQADLDKENRYYANTED